MEKWTRRLAVAAMFAAAAVLALPRPGSARLTGTSTAAETCWGAAGAEACVDASGNVVPTTDNDADLGTSALRWRDLRVLDATLGDALTVVGSVTVNGSSELGNTVNTDVTLVNTATSLANTTVVSSGAVAIYSTSTVPTHNVFRVLDNGGLNMVVVQATGAVILNEQGVDADFRVESDNNANMLFVDADLDRLGVGSDATPDAVLELAPRSDDTEDFSLLVSSQNGSTNVLDVDITGIRHSINAGAGFLPWSRTQAQIDTLVPLAAGEIIFCSNCSVLNACISTGTAAGQWARMDLATAGCGSNN